jgi:hypothetical protein
MEDAPNNSAVGTTKDPNTDTKAGSGSESGPDSRAGANQGSTDQGSTDQGSTDRGSTKESGESSDRSSTADANRNSASESAGKPPAPANADRGEGSNLDPKLEALVEAKIDARLKSILESHLEPLLAVNRQLALFLGEQLENMIELRQSVCAMERLLEADAHRKSKYAAMLEKVKGEGAGMKDPHWINRTRGMLSRLERSGTLGPKRDDEPAQA